jgi:hypothetical protein
MGAVSVAVEETLQAAARHDDPPAEPQGREIPPSDELVGVRSRDPEGRSGLGHGEDETVVVTHAVTSKDGPQTRPVERGLADKRAGRDGAAIGQRAGEV